MERRGESIELTWRVRGGDAKLSEGGGEVVGSFVVDRHN